MTNKKPKISLKEEKETKKYCNLKQEKNQSRHLCNMLNILLIIHTEVHCVHVAYVKTKLSQPYRES